MSLTHVQRFSEGCRFGNCAGLAPSGAAAVRFHHPGCPVVGRSRMPSRRSVLIYEFYTLSKADHQDLILFMQAFMVGMLVRLLVVGVIIFLLIKFTNVHLTSFVFSLFGFYMLYLIIELYFVVRGSRKHA
jgi:hypothetical protein